MSAFLQSFADALNVSEAEARAALEGFARRVRSRAGEDEVTYGGLGTFHTEGGRLRFTPDESVALVVNHRYAGMEPIALGAGAPPTWQPGTPDSRHPLGPPPAEVFEDVPFEEVEEEPQEAASAEADAPPEKAEAPWADVPPPPTGAALPPLFASDETLMALRDAAREMESAPPSADADDWAARMIEEEGVPEVPPAAPEAEQEPPPAAEEVPEPEELPPPPPLSPEFVPAEAQMEPPPDLEGDFEPEAPPEPVAADPAEEAEAVPRLFPPIPPRPLPQESPLAEPSSVPEDRPVVTPRPVRTPPPPPVSARRFPWLPAVLLLALVVALVAVLVLRDPEPVVTPAAPPVGAADSVQTPDTSAAVAETPPTPAETPVETPPAAEPETALRGTSPVVAGSGYTLVIGGGTQAEAERLAAPFRAQGYRTGVLAGRTDSGAAIYRTAIGQFNSLGAAQSALRNVSGLPAGAWILNLRSPLVRPE